MKFRKERLKVGARMVKRMPSEGRNESVDVDLDRL